MTDTEKSLIAMVDTLQSTLKYYADQRCWSQNVWIGPSAYTTETGWYLAQRALEQVARISTSVGRSV